MHHLVTKLKLYSKGKVHSERDIFCLLTACCYGCAPTNLSCGSLEKAQVKQLFSDMVANILSHFMILALQFCFNSAEVQYQEALVMI
jgi:hypothetical protein